MRRLQYIVPLQYHGCSAKEPHTTAGRQARQDRAPNGAANESAQRGIRESPGACMQADGDGTGESVVALAGARPDRQKKKERAGCIVQHVHNTCCTLFFYRTVFASTPTARDAAPQSTPHSGMSAHSRTRTYIHILYIHTYIRTLQYVLSATE